MGGKTSNTTEFSLYGTRPNYDLRPIQHKKKKSPNSISVGGRNSLATGTSSPAKNSLLSSTSFHFIPLGHGPFLSNQVRCPSHLLAAKNKRSLRQPRVYISYKESGVEALRIGIPLVGRPSVATRCVKERNLQLANSREAGGFRRRKIFMRGVIDFNSKSRKTVKRSVNF